MCTHLSTLQISPHGTFSADGHTSAIENAQHKHWECEQHHEYTLSTIAVTGQPEAQNTPLHGHTAAGHTSHQQEETTYPASDLDESTQSFWPWPKHLTQKNIQASLNDLYNISTISTTIFSIDNEYFLRSKSAYYNNFWKIMWHWWLE